MKKENKYYSTKAVDKVDVSNEEWKSILEPEVYRIARQSGTEYAYSGQYNKHFETGQYHCKVCGNKLFTSDTKFESSCGWPAFFEASSKTSMKYIEDNSHGMNRVEVRCGRCDSHLGHVFNDGPPPTGKRYCINSKVIQFEDDEKE
jgi:peptide-methionine (R)-S-oxide reductase